MDSKREKQFVSPSDAINNMQMVTSQVDNVAYSDVCLYIYVCVCVGDKVALTRIGDHLRGYIVRFQS